MSIKGQKPDIIATYVGVVILICNFWLIITQPITFNNIDDYYRALKIIGPISFLMRIIIAIWVGFIAARQNRIRGWAILAFLFPSIILIIIGFLEPLNVLRPSKEDTGNNKSINNNQDLKSSTEITSANDSSKKNCYGRISFYFSIASLLGVIALFILYFTGKSGSKFSTQKTNKSSLTVGFVSSDSIMVNYEMVKVMKTDLEAKQKKAEDNFAIQQKSFETQVIEYQKKMQANSLSIDQAKSTEKLLGQQQQTLLDLKDQLSQALAEEEFKMNIALQDSIMNFLKRYNRKHNYDYILGFSKGSGILFANDSLDITKEIIEGLNKEYKTK